MRVLATKGRRDGLLNQPCKTRLQQAEAGISLASLGLDRGSCVCGGVGEMNFTRGPWHPYRKAADSERFSVIDNYGNDIAKVIGTAVTRSRRWRDTQLMATSLDLLEALQALHNRLIECTKTPASAADAYDSYFQEMVCAAINKALGKE